MSLKSFHMMIGGQEREARSGETLESIAPYPQTAWATFPAATSEDVDEAVRSSHQAFMESWWRNDPKRRAWALEGLADLLDAAAPQLAKVESFDCGKPMREAQGIGGSISGFFRYAAALCVALPQGEIQQGSSPLLVQHTVRQPYGVIAIQVPWNNPLGVLVQECALALGAGNAVVIKPSEFNGCSVLEFAKVVQRSEIPPGIFNVVSGLGPVVGAALCEHPLVRKIIFTGGADAARIIARQAAERFVPLVLELGGKSPAILFDDAHLELAVRGILGGFTGSTGQSCTAASRTLVQASVYDEFAERLVAAASNVVLGDPGDMKTEMGPLTSAEHAARVTARVQAGIDEGAKLLYGGDRPTGALADHPLFFLPTIFGDVSNSMRIAQDEVFGPVSCLIRFEDEKDAISIANDTTYGLTASVWSNDINRIQRTVGELYAGTVWVNGHRTGDPSYAFGGMKESGYGRENGIPGFEEMTYIKSIRYTYRPG